MIPHQPGHEHMSAAPHLKSERSANTVDVTQLGQFDEWIDVRSESEFAEDHIPGAINCPVLNDAERAQVGTIYKQVSAFDAKKTGAALVSANIARHLRERLHDRPRDWRPLVYCWRGGGRSGALSHVLTQIGWFKITKRLTGEGKRIFRMAPLHHHFELKGWPEPRVIVRFWIITVVRVLIGLSSLKVR